MNNGRKEGTMLDSIEAAGLLLVWRRKDLGGTG